MTISIVIQATVNNTDTIPDSRFNFLWIKKKMGTQKVH